MRHSQEWNVTQASLMLNSHHITGVLLHTLVHTHTQKTLNSTNYKVFASFSRLARVQNIVRSSKGAQFSIRFWKGHERDIPLVFISSYPKSSVNDRWTMASSLHCSSPYCRSSSPSGVLWLFLFVGKVPLTSPQHTEGPRVVYTVKGLGDALSTPSGSQNVYECIAI